MKRVVCVAPILIGAVLVLAACNGGQAGQETPNPTATPIGSGTATTATPSPVVQAECPTPTVCPAPTACPVCPQPVTCPTCPEPITCPTCPTCPQPVVCPTCPEPVTCPPAASQMSDYCTSMKMVIEQNEIELEMAIAGRLTGGTAQDVGANIADYQQIFDQNCQGVPLAEPSWVGVWCANAGIWYGREERDAGYAPDAQTQAWARQFDAIIDRYCARSGPP